MPLKSDVLRIDARLADYLKTWAKRENMTVVALTRRIYTKIIHKRGKAWIS